MKVHYREDCELWWPDYDHDEVKCLSFVQNGLKDMDLAIRHAKARRVCVQAGGHVGLWPLRLAKTFRIVHSFECEPLLTECMRRNCAATPNVLIYGKALGAFVGEVKMRGAVSAGSWNIHEAGKHTAQQTTIDAMNLDECDAIFLDVEAYEVEALNGAEQTINRCKPVLHVEELPRSKDAIQAHMQSIGYRMRDKVHSDVIYTPR